MFLKTIKKRVWNITLFLYVYDMNNKTVTDILYIGVDHTPLSFNQVSHKSKKYEAICPFCANKVGVVKADTYGDLAFKLYDLQVKHINSCVNKFEIDISIFNQKEDIEISSHYLKSQDQLSFNFSIQSLAPNGSVLESIMLGDCTIDGIGFSRLTYGDDNVSTTSLKIQPRKYSIVYSAYYITL